VAVEAAMTTVLTVEVVKGVYTPWPRLESDTHLMSIGATRPPEDAYRIAAHDLVTWLAQLSGLELLDTYRLVAQAGDAPVGNVCDSNYTFMAELAKNYLRSPVNRLWRRPCSAAPARGPLGHNREVMTAPP
jgi:amidase